MDHEDCFRRGYQYLIDRKYPEAIISYEEGWDALEKDETYSGMTRTECCNISDDLLEVGGYEAVAWFLFEKYLDKDELEDDPDPDYPFSEMMDSAFSASIDRFSQLDWIELGDFCPWMVYFYVESKMHADGWLPYVIRPLQTYLGINFNDPEIWLERPLDPRQKERFEDLLENLEIILSIDSSDVFAHMLSGRLLERMGETEKAYAHYVMASLLCEDDYRPLLCIASLLESTGKYSLAGKLRKEVQEKYPLEGFITTEFMELELLGLYHEILRVYDDMKDEEGRSFSENMIARVLEKLGKYREALELCNSVIRDSKYPFLLDLSQKGVLLYKVGEFEESKEILVGITGESGEDLEMHYNKYLFEAQDYWEFDSTRPWLYMGLLMIKDERYEDALEYLNYAKMRGGYRWDVCTNPLADLAYGYALLKSKMGYADDSEFQEQMDYWLVSSSDNPVIAMAGRMEYLLHTIQKYYPDISHRMNLREGSDISEVRKIAGYR